MTVVMVIAGLGVLSLAFIWVSNLLFATRVGELRDRMIASQQQGGLVGGALPELVRSYAVRAGGRIGAPLVFHARHEATLATSRHSPPISITAEQWTGTAGKHECSSSQRIRRLRRGPR